jgi:iron(III) transport system substrate-binding protein
VQACSTADPSSPAGEEGNQKLTVACGAQEDWCQAVTRAFQQKTGIETSFVRLSSGEAVARLGAAKGEFDVWHGGPSDGYVAAGASSLIEAYVSPEAAKIPAKYKDASGLWTGVYVGVLGFCSNTKVLRREKLEAPTSWQGLTDPRLRKLVSIAHPGTSGTAYTALWTQVKLAGDPDGALRYFKTLSPNVLQYSKSGSAPAQQAGRGEVAIGVVFTHDCVKAQEEGLTDLTVTLPSEGTGYEVGGVAIVKGTGNLAAAKRYVDFAISAEAQNIGPTVKSYQAPTNPDTTRSPKAVDLTAVTLVDYDGSVAGEAKKDLVARFEADVATAPKE